MNTGQITVAQVESRIRERAAGSIPKDFSIAADTRITDLGLSSLTLGELLMELEDELGTEFDSQRLAEAETVGQLIDLMNSCQVS